MQKEIKYEAIQHWTASKIKQKEIEKKMKSNGMILTPIGQKSQLEANTGS